MASVGVTATGLLPEIRLTGSGQFGAVCADQPEERTISVCNVGAWRISRLHDPSQRSAVPFCHGLRNQVRLGVISSDLMVLDTSLEKIESSS